MSIRVKVANGVLVPIDPLPAEFTEGVEVAIAPIDATSLNGESEHPEIETGRYDEDGLSDEEADALQKFLDESRRLGKEHMRKVMELLK